MEVLVPPNTINERSLFADFYPVEINNKTKLLDLYEKSVIIVI